MATPLGWVAGAQRGRFLAGGWRRVRRVVAGEYQVVQTRLADNLYALCATKDIRPRAMALQQPHGGLRPPRGQLISRQCSQKRPAVINVSRQPCAISFLGQDHDHALFIHWLVKQAHQRMFSCVDREHGVAVDRLATLRLPPRPQSGDAQRLTVGTGDACRYRLTAAPVRLEDHISGDDAVLSLEPGITKTGLAGYRLTAGVVGEPGDRLAGDASTAKSYSDDPDRTKRRTFSRSIKSKTTSMWYRSGKKKSTMSGP